MPEPTFVDRSPFGPPSVPHHHHFEKEPLAPQDHRPNGHNSPQVSSSSTDPKTPTTSSQTGSPSTALSRRGFLNRVPVFTHARLQPRPSMLDALDKQSEIRKSNFWGVGKFILVSLVYWMFANLYRQYLDRGYIMDYALFASMAKPAIECFSWWALAVTWSFNAHLNIIFVLQSNRSLSCRIHRIFTEILLFVATIAVSMTEKMGVISSGFCFALGCIYLMKAHSYIETNYDLISQEVDEKPFQPPMAKEFMYFLLAPTLIYEPNFPRFDSKNRIRNIFIRGFVLVFTLLFFYVWLTEKTIPIMVRLHQMSFIEGLIRSLVPIWVTSILIFYTVFEMICNILADITSFGDRQFYGDWWNSTTFEEFNRLWNKPVHEFLLRHVYFKIVNIGIPKFWASFHTVLASAVVHEIGLLVCTKRPTFLFFFSFMMTQPLIFRVQNACGMKGSQFGNYFFWAGLALGLAVSSTFYGRKWAALNEEENIRFGWLPRVPEARYVHGQME